MILRQPETARLLNDEAIKALCRSKRLIGSRAAGLRLRQLRDGDRQMLDGRTFPATAAPGDCLIAMTTPREVAYATAASPVGKLDLALGSRPLGERGLGTVVSMRQRLGRRVVPGSVIEHGDRPSPALMAMCPRSRSAVWLREERQQPRW